MESSTTDATSAAMPIATTAMAAHLAAGSAETATESSTVSATSAATQTATTAMVAHLAAELAMMAMG